MTRTWLDGILFRSGRWALALSLALVWGSVAGRAQPAEARMLTTREIATRFIHALFVDHDLEAAYGRFAVANFIQHNAEIEDGVDGEKRFFAHREAAHPGKYLPVDQWSNMIDHIMVDGDLFAVHHHVFTNPNDRGRVFVDIWRVANGKIVEHWDIIQPVPDKQMNDATMWCGTGNSFADVKAAGDPSIQPSCGLPDAHASREATLATFKAYVRLAVDEGRPAEAVDKFVAPDFIQHSPHIGPGKAALRAYFSKQYDPSKAGSHQSRTVRILAEGDLVLAHRHYTSDGDPLGKVYADLFRIKNGQIVEHWDVMEAVPAKTASGHTVW